jgi:hypothetical protein
MSRSFLKSYRFRVFALMAAYIAVLFFVWPHAQSATILPVKIALSVAPTLPVITVLWLMALRVMRSDELEQRVHLMALSVATAAVAAVSLVGGFLSASGVIHVDGDILIWVFPSLCLSYGLARWIVGRRYGGVGCG